MKYLHKMKTVNYFGLELTIEERFRFLHTDSNGEVWATEEKPHNHNGVMWAISPTEWGFKQIAEVDLEGMNWYDSLLEV